MRLLLTVCLLLPFCLGSHAKEPISAKVISELDLKPSAQKLFNDPNFVDDKKPVSSKDGLMALSKVNDIKTDVGSNIKPPVPGKDSLGQRVNPMKAGGKRLRPRKKKNKGKKRPMRPVWRPMIRPYGGRKGKGKTRLSSKGKGSRKQRQERRKSRQQKRKGSMSRGSKTPSVSTKQIKDQIKTLSLRKPSSKSTKSLSGRRPNKRQPKRLRFQKRKQRKGRKQVGKMSRVTSGKSGPKMSTKRMKRPNLRANRKMTRQSKKKQRKIAKKNRKPTQSIAIPSKTMPLQSDTAKTIPIVGEKDGVISEPRVV